ncbi:MAG: phage tail tape measure protein [Planctomycetaceae bacterium]|jgi:TP901 family phage tail tape measure protein|nr:phage tail tape measure protein [Planctomycetaceae bacterium]
MSTILKSGTLAFEIIGIDKNVMKSLDRVQTGFTGLSAKIRDSLLTMASFRTAFQGFSAPLQVFANFEAGISKVKAITQATTEQIAALREQAKALGKTTFFTASQVADAQKFLGMAGFRSEQIKAATPQVLDLALSGDMDLGMAADIATNISTPFKIAAEELSRVNDVLAKANTTSNTNVQELGQAFKYVAPAAAAAGQSIEECGAAFAILANNGIKADMAGTAMRMMLIKLADSGIQKKLKEQFDIDAKDVTGNLRPLMSVLQELKDKVSSFDNADQMSVFYDIFENRAGTAALVLGNAGDAATDFRMKMINAAGTASEMAKIMADNMKGDYIALISAYEGVQIAFGDAVNQMSREWLQFGTTITRGIADFITENKEFVASVAKIVTGLGGAVGTILLFTATVHGIAYAYNAVKSAIAMFIPLKAAETAAENANATAIANTTAATASATAAINTETAAVAANTVAKTKNAAANAAYSAFKSGAIYGVAADTTRFSKEAAMSSATAFQAAATARMKTAQASNVLTASEQRLITSQLVGASTTKVVTAETVRLATTQNTATAATRIATTAVVADTAAKTTATAATWGFSAAIKAIPGWGWAIAGIAAVTGLVLWLSKAKDLTKDWTDEMKNFWNEIETIRKSAEKKVEIKTSDIATDTKIFDVLKQYSGQTLKVDADFDYAVKAAEQLVEKYGDIGITIDRVNKTIAVSTEAQKKFNAEIGKQAAAEKENLLNERKKVIEDKKKELDQLKKNGAEGVVLQNGGKYISDDSKKKHENAVTGLTTDIENAEKELNKLQEEIDNLNKGNVNSVLGKDQSQALQETLDESASVQDKLKDIEKNAETIFKQMNRDRRSALENEILELEERNEKYKEYLELLIKSEHDSKKKAFYQTELDNADNNLQNDINRAVDKKLEGYQDSIDTTGMSEFEKELYIARQKAKKEREDAEKIIDTAIAQLDPKKDSNRIQELKDQKADLADVETESVQKIRDKAKVDVKKLATPEQMKVTEARENLNLAYESKDVEKIKKAKEELKQAKDDLLTTSYKNVQEALKTAQEEYQQALAAFNNAKTEDEKAITGQKLNDANEKLEEATSDFDNISEQKYEKKLNEALQHTQVRAGNEAAGTFNAFEMGNMRGNNVEKTLEKQVTNQLETIRVLRDIKNKKGKRWG